MNDIMDRSQIVYAEAEGGAGVESIALFMDEALIAVENVTPYALFGDISGNFRGGTPLDAGNYDFRLDAYAANRAQGDLLERHDLTLNVMVEEYATHLMLVG